MSCVDAILPHTDSSGTLTQALHPSPAQDRIARHSHSGVTLPPKVLQERNSTHGSLFLFEGTPGFTLEEASAWKAQAQGPDLQVDQD